MTLTCFEIKSVGGDQVISVRYLCDAIVVDVVVFAELVL